MRKILLNKLQHQDLYIFEGGLNKFNFHEENLKINISSVNYPELPVGTKLPNYLDPIDIEFNNISYLKFGLSGPFPALIEFGDISDPDLVLDYGGAWGDFSEYDKIIPRGFELYLICEDIILYLPD